MLALVIGDFHIPSRQFDIPLKFKKLLVPGKIQYCFATGNTLPASTIHSYLKTISANVFACSLYDKPKVVCLENWRILLLPPDTPLFMYDMLARQHGAHLCLGNGAYDVIAIDSGVGGCLVVDPGTATGAWDGSCRAASSNPHIETFSGNPHKDKDKENVETTEKEDKENVETTDKEKQEKENQEKEKQGQEQKNITVATSEENIKNSGLGLDSTPSFVLMDISAQLLTLFIYKLCQDNVKVEKIEFKKPSSRDQEIRII